MHSLAKLIHLNRTSLVLLVPLKLGYIRVPWTEWRGQSTVNSIVKGSLFLTMNGYSTNNCPAVEFHSQLIFEIFWWTSSSIIYIEQGKPQLIQCLIRTNTDSFILFKIFYPPFSVLGSVFILTVYGPVASQLATSQKFCHKKSVSSWKGIFWHKFLGEIWV